MEISWERLVKWLKTYMDSFMNAFVKGKVFANAVVRVLMSLDGHELSQVRERLLPTSEERLQHAAFGDIHTSDAEEALICALRDKSCLLELLKDPEVAAAIARLAPKKDQPKRKTWADEAREGINNWLGKVDGKPRERLEMILRIGEETDRWPSRALVASMLEWPDFSEEEVRRWLSRLDDDGYPITKPGRPPSAAPPAKDGPTGGAPAKRPRRRETDGPKAPQPGPEDQGSTNHLGDNLGKDTRLAMASKIRVDKWKTPGLGPGTIGKLVMNGVRTIGKLASLDLTAKENAELVSAVGRKKMEAFVAAAKATVEQIANGHRGTVPPGSH